MKQGQYVDVKVNDCTPATLFGEHQVEGNDFITKNMKIEG